MRDLSGFRDLCARRPLQNANCPHAEFASRLDIVIGTIAHHDRVIGSTSCHFEGFEKNTPVWFFDIDFSGAHANRNPRTQPDSLKALPKPGGLVGDDSESIFSAASLQWVGEC